MKQEVAPTANVSRHLLQFIKTCRLRPGDQLPPIRDLAALWGLNASAVRSGLLKAETMGLVEIRPRAGAFVTEFRYERIMDLVSMVFDMALQHEEPRLLHLYEMRAVLEREAFRRAARVAVEEDIYELTRAYDRLCCARTRREEVKADEAFHLLVARIAGNPVMTVILDVLLGLMRPGRALNTPTAEERRHSQGLHRELLKAIRRKNAQQAAFLAAAHTETRKQGLLKLSNHLLKKSDNNQT